MRSIFPEAGGGPVRTLKDWTLLEAVIYLDLELSVLVIAIIKQIQNDDALQMYPVLCLSYKVYMVNSRMPLTFCCHSYNHLFSGQKCVQK